ncbi:omptin family outer membrane protease [Elizabethkingia anophelis]|uniref:omptin family outer membrane protease n=1 Tax=Elizabethkingia anophelis TaxID=1117645 RepID=UPI0021A3381C
MNKWYTILLISLYYSIYAQEGQRKSYIIPNIGWKQEELNWNIAGNENGQYPNVLSELKWQQLSGPEMGIISGLSISSRFQVKWDFSYQVITSGKVNDTDYAGDNRALKTAEFNLQADKGYTIKTRLELAYLLWSNQTFSFSPHVGYFGSYQMLYMLDGDAPLIPGKELRSTYKPQWHGAVLGLETSFKKDNWNVNLDISGMYFPQYSATADWNLREELRRTVSFEHRSKGAGFDEGLRIGYQIGQRIQPFVSAQYTQIKAGKGTDKLYMANEDIYTSRLNEVNYFCFSFNIGINFFL